MNPRTHCFTFVRNEMRSIASRTRRGFLRPFATRRHGLPDVPLRKIVVDTTDSSGDTVYAATWIGVYRTTDGGAHWTLFGAGLPRVDVSDLVHRTRWELSACIDLRPRRLGSRFALSETPDSALLASPARNDRRAASFTASKESIWPAQPGRFCPVSWPQSSRLAPLR